MTFATAGFLAQLLLRCQTTAPNGHGAYTTSEQMVTCGHLLIRSAFIFNKFLLTAYWVWGPGPLINPKTQTPR